MSNPALLQLFVAVCVHGAVADAPTGGPVPRARAADGPATFGRSRLTTAGVGNESVHWSLDPTLGSEAFAITPSAGGAAITAGDEVGAMYAMLELAERVRRDGAHSLATARVQSAPFLRDRGLNVFLTLPWSYEKNDTDNDPAALVDPERWWFQNEDYWTTLLDQMAESRLNWLDLHGAWDISVTNAPNLYAYFIQSEPFPEVGVAPEIKAKNLDRLNWVIEHAHARGIRVSLMAYEARLRTPHRRDVPYPDDEPTTYSYTRDVVERMIRQAPALDAIGFRIGESGHGGDFFRCYGEAVTKSGRDIPLYTRSWVTQKAKVVPLARASSDFTVEIKYDGEQWAAPYPFSGGRVANWHSYSFEDYLSDSCAIAADGNSAPKKLWPGNSVEGGERWPEQPYKIVWQVRANGTHRIFPFFEPEWVRRSIEPMKVGTASGFTVEPMNAYFPASPRYYVADPARVPCNWIHQRDELFLMQWGRLGYDPKTPDAVFDQRLRERFGAAAEPLAKGWRAASHVVPLALLSHAFGPDHRDDAPELEWGGSTHEWIEGEGLDTHAFLPIREEIALRTTGGSDGRIGARAVAGELERAAETAESTLVDLNRTIDSAPEKGRAYELRCALEQLARLGRYFAGRLRSAWWTALADAAPGTAGARLLANEQMTSAWKAWTDLSGPSRDPTAGHGEDAAADFYRAFTDRLRMHTNTFRWRDQLAQVTREKDAIAQLGSRPGAASDAELAAARALAATESSHPTAALPHLTWKESGSEIVATLPARGVDRAWLLAKPLPSSTFFHRLPMKQEGSAFVARLPRERAGHLLAAEIQHGGETHRLPDPLIETPWLVVPSKTGATPLVYSTEEALAHLDPTTLDPAKHGLLVVAPRAWEFFRDFDAVTQRKLLDAVARGMKLLILQQDYKSGRYPLAWLPNPPRVEEFRTDAFDPAGALHLDVVNAPDVLWQRFAATPGWEVPGNGGVAHQRIGKGELWMVQARLIQNLHLPSCARALLTLLRGGGVEKPVVLIDPGTENNRFGTSVIPDFLNAHEIPFLTLGEVIAATQGVAAAAVQPAPPWDDLVLGNRGASQQQHFLDEQAKHSAMRPLPATPSEFEAQRPAQKQLVMQALGLDPLPPRTPLNAKVVGVLPRDGYRIEKIVFESQPGFLVTAHLYVPAGATDKLPVILNPHGHWEHKKLEPVVQQRMIQQALHGYLAMIVDSPGFSFEGEALIERRFAGSHDDFRSQLGSCCAGAVYVWDLMRALDYLETRPEADMKHVGITGASGGGHATLWTFAADERIGAAVPVVFASSLEIEPHNGCACNHIPGTLRIGDRADTLAVRAPAPILLIGASDDREFPPAGMRRTGDKLARLWELHGAAGDVGVRIFESKHDYSLDMVATALGFFERHLKGVGDGSPLTLVAHATEPVDAAELFCLPQPPTDARSMRDLAVARLAGATKQPRTLDPAEFLRHNGALPPGAPTEVVARDEHGALLPFPKSGAEAGALANHKLFVCFESEPGLTIPALLWLPRAAPRATIVLVTDDGKSNAAARFTIDKLVMGGFACLAVDPRGIGELEGLDLRLLIYRNCAPAFAAAIDLERAVQIVRPLAPRVVVVGDGAIGSLAALSLALMRPDLDAVIGRGGMHEFADAFDESVPLLAIQPQADLLPPLSRLRTAVKPPSLFTFRGDPSFDLYAALLRLLKM